MKSNDRDSSGAIVWLVGTTIVLILAGLVDLISHFV